jgi:ISXO2-like transposase domain
MQTIIGTVKGHVVRRSVQHKQKVLSLVERGGEVRSFKFNATDAGSLKPIIDANLSEESRLMTGSTSYYKKLGREFASHEIVEYVRGDCHVNTLENFFSVFKRGMKGVYQHCDEKHLHRYLAEFDFRYNNRIAKGVNDEARASKMIEGTKGKRLTYRTTAN